MSSLSRDLEELVAAVRDLERERDTLQDRVEDLTDRVEELQDEIEHERAKRNALAEEGEEGLD